MVILVLRVPLCAAGEQNQATEKKDEAANLRQYVSAKVGFYQPSDGLNNGLLAGIDGITEFIHHDFFLSGAADVYYKQTFSNFKDPQPNVTQQSIVVLPLHVNFGYKVFDSPSDDFRGYVGVGGGYYFYFYTVEYTSGSGGILGSLTPQQESQNSGNVFATFFARALLGQVFLEPRYYIATKKEASIGNYTYVVNPTGFAITLGFQYH